jgi:methionyl-tRNA synthetase
LETLLSIPKLLYQNLLTANAPETKDNDFTWKDFQQRNNSELVAILGNFVNRALVLTQKYFNNIVPERGALTDFDIEVLESIKEFPTKISAQLETYHLREALRELMNLARLGNKYLADTEPWKVIKTDEGRVKTILNIALQIVGNLSVLGNPFLPFSMEKLRRMVDLHQIDWSAGGDIDMLKMGHALGKSELLFDLIEDAAIEAQVQRLLDTKTANEKSQQKANPQKESISFDDFSKLDIRTGTIIEAELVPKTKKLLKLKIDTGIDQRTVVSGIAEFHQPEDVIGKQVSILINLAPRHLKGIESQGMILMAENSDGKLVFVSPTEKVENGSDIK